MTTDPAIIEAAALALHGTYRSHSDMAEAVVAAITPMIEAAALEKAAKVAEEYHKRPYPGSGTKAYWIAATIRALIAKDSGGGD